MLDLFLHSIFTLNLAVFLAVVTWFVGRRVLPAGGSHRPAFVLACLAVVGINVTYVSLFVGMLPDFILSTDGERYFFEIREIAKAPWLWNPITGSGPYYDVTAKMGMSYLYGVVLFLHQIDSLYAVLALNVVFGYLAGLVVFARTLRLHPAVAPALAAMLLASLYPEMLFWTARVTRENVTLFLVPLLVLASIRYRETFRPSYLLVAVVTCIALLLTRAQLVFFAVLILAFLGIIALRSAARWKALLATAVGAGGLFVAFRWIEQQLRRAVGGDLLGYFSLDPAFWMEQVGMMVQNFGSVISPVARGAYGAFGIILAPVVLVVFGLLFLSLARTKAIFGSRAWIAGLHLFLIGVFLLMLAAAGSVNIRFRATVAPLLLPLITVTAYHYWAALHLPALRLRSRRRVREPSGKLYASPHTGG